MNEHHFDGQYIDPIIQAPLRVAMHHEDPRWLTSGNPRLVNHPADKGGLTRGGITAKRWGQYKGLARPATAEELLAITFEQGLRFYYVEYVLAPKFDELPDQRIRALCIDWSFTSGPDDPWRAVQASLQTRGLYTGALDGLPGPKTRKAVLLDRDQRQTYRDVLRARAHHYLNLALNDAPTRAFMADNPTLQLHNIRGWLNRTLEFQL